MSERDNQPDDDAHNAASPNPHPGSSPSESRPLPPTRLPQRQFGVKAPQLSPGRARSLDIDQMSLPPKTSCTERPLMIIKSESETSCGWEYEIEFSTGAAGKRTTSHKLTLGWRDHDYWSGGRLAPSITIEQVIAIAAKYLTPDGLHNLPATFDAARLRRLCPGLDADIRGGAVG